MKHKNPLVLTMGHPVKDRLSRLSRKKGSVRRGARESIGERKHILASLQVSRGQGLNSLLLEDAVAPIIHIYH